MTDQFGNRAPGGNILHDQGVDPLSRCLSLDLEVGWNDGNIHVLAGVRPGTDKCFTFNRHRGLPQALSRLDELARGADFLLDHNLINFDLLYMRAANPNLRLSCLPTDQRHAAPV